MGCSISTLWHQEEEYDQMIETVKAEVCSDAFSSQLQNLLKQHDKGCAFSEDVIDFDADIKEQRKEHLAQTEANRITSEKADNKDDSEFSIDSQQLPSDDKLFCLLNDMEKKRNDEILEKVEEFELMLVLQHEITRKQKVDSYGATPEQIASAAKLLEIRSNILKHDREAWTVRSKAEAIRQEDIGSKKLIQLEGESNEDFAERKLKLEEEEAEILIHQNALKEEERLVELRMQQKEYMDSVALYREVARRQEEDNILLLAEEEVERQRLALLEEQYEEDAYVHKPLSEDQKLENLILGEEVNERNNILLSMMDIEVSMSKD